MELEYLIISKRDEEFCSDKTSFENLLSVDTSLNIDKEKHIITDLSSGFNVKYKLEYYDNDNRSERVFDLLLNTQNDDSSEEFSQIARKIRKIVIKINSEVTVCTIRNDIGRKKSILAYPIIFDVENLMRRLIYRFMYINVGMQWVNQALSDDIKKSMGNKNRSNLGDYLHNLDFIELSSLLFQTYTNIPFQTFQNKLIELSDLHQFDITHLEDIIPKSNWERYFSNVIKVDNKDFEKKWRKLYDLRNLVAHNNFIDSVDFDLIKKISSEITNNLQTALQKLNDIKLTKEEIVMVKNSVAINTLEQNNVSTKIYQINLLKAAKMLNIGIGTAVNYLISQGFDLEAKPTTRLTPEEGYVLFKKFGNLNDYKKELSRLSTIGYFN